MRSYIQWSAAILFALAATTGCTHAPKGDKAETTTAQTASGMTGNVYVANTETSYIRFTGNGVGKNHPGKFFLSSGKVSVENGRPTGDFIIRIGSLKLEENNEMIQGKLGPHLMSADFFNEVKYPEGKFQLTGAEPRNSQGANGESIVEGANYEISGNLTLKDVTKNVSFPARVTVAGNKLTAKANFNIDRTQWGIVYGNDRSLGDKFISETVNIEINLEANRQ